MTDLIGVVEDAELQINVQLIEGSAKGDPGGPGAKGEQGDTPIKGTDYWTASDKAEIVSDVLDALPDGDEVGY